MKNTINTPRIGFVNCMHVLTSSALVIAYFKRGISSHKSHHRSYRNPREGPSAIHENNGNVKDKKHERTCRKPAGCCCMVVTFCCRPSRGAEGSRATPVRPQRPLERDQDSEAGGARHTQRKRARERERERVNNKQGNKRQSDTVIKMKLSNNQQQPPEETSHASVENEAQTTDHTYTLATR